MTIMVEIDKSGDCVISELGRQVAIILSRQHILVDPLRELFSEVGFKFQDTSVDEDTLGRVSCVGFLCKVPVMAEEIPICAFDGDESILAATNEDAGGRTGFQTKPVSDL